MKNSELFSKKALDKLHSPDKLDSLLEVTNPISWMTLAAAAVMIFSVIIWSIFGAMVVKVEGVGILLDSAGIINVTSISSGKVDDVFIRTGMRIYKGDIIASLSQPNQSTETIVARSDMFLSSNALEAETRAAQYDAKRYQQDVNELIVSEYDGIVDEISVLPGNVIASGSSICTIRRDQNRDELSGFMYVPVKNGKRVEPGMSIQLSPNGVDTSEAGSLLAIVRSVSQYPVSANAMLNRLGNEQLVEWVLSKADNAVMEVSFDLVKDETSKSGYLWTSIVGEHKLITPGSICTGSIIVDSKPPIEKVFYKVSQWLRSR